MGLMGLIDPQLLHLEASEGKPSVRDEIICATGYADCLVCSVAEGVRLEARPMGWWWMDSRQGHS